MVAYLSNIAILVPVCVGMFGGRAAATVFEGKVLPSPQLEQLVGALWFAILATSILGLVWPQTFAPILILQVIYKALFLVGTALPLWRSGKEVPLGVTGSFIAIVASYPFLIWFGWNPA